MQITVQYVGDMLCEACSRHIGVTTRFVRKDLFLGSVRRATDPGQTFGHIDMGKILVLLNREDYWQCAFVIAKGTADAIRQRGLESFRAEIAALAPFLR